MKLPMAHVDVLQMVARTIIKHHVILQAQVLHISPDIAQMKLLLE